MNYPITIKLENDKLKILLTEKEELILQGREKSMEIDALDGEMETIDKELRELEKKADISEFRAEADALTVEFNAIEKRMSELNERVRAKIKESTPQSLRDKYDEAKKKKQDLELERNKIALKVEQKKDKIIPLGQKLMKPYLQDEYDDFDTLRIENGEIVATIFNHLEDFKANFAKRKDKKVAGLD